jgi:hypothetical protein
VNRSILHLRTWGLTGLAVIFAILLALSFAPGWLRLRRQPTEHERVLYYFAQNVGETALCARISWAAHQSYSVIFGGGGASYLRSDCYERVAQSRGDAAVCWHVRPLVDFNPLSSGYSALSCLHRTRARHSSGTALSDALLIRTFERLGYDIDAIHIDGVLPAAIRLHDVYYVLEHDPATLARSQQLLTAPGTPLPAEDERYIAHLAAVGTNDPRWCESIPAAEPADPAAPSRDWCYLTLTYNTNDVRVCERMTPASAEPKVRDAEAHGVRPWIAEQMGLHGECLRVATRRGPAVHYGPSVPIHEEQTRQLLSELQAIVPMARDWTANQQAVFYQRFLFALWPRRPSDLMRPAARPLPSREAARIEADEQAHEVARDVARATLVQRLLALPADP